MTREQQLNAAEDHERRAARIRARFGLLENPNESRVREWLHSSGAIPATLAIAAIVAYLIISLINNLFGS